MVRRTLPDKRLIPLPTRKYADDDGEPGELLAELVEGAWVPVESLAPPLLGNPGQPMRDMRVDPEELEPEPQMDGWRPALPAPCLRLLSLPRDPGCPSAHCPGWQRDGSCLLDIVRRAQQQGIPWTFAVDSQGYWVYDGPPLL